MLTADGTGYKGLMEKRKGRTKETWDGLSGGVGAQVGKKNPILGTWQRGLGSMLEEGILAISWGLHIPGPQVLIYGMKEFVTPGFTFV